MLIEITTNNIYILLYIANHFESTNTILLFFNNYVEKAKRTNSKR